jgi:type VI secretion system ImpA family protein
MEVDVESLLAPVSDAAPMGDDLTYDDARVALDDAFERVVRDDFDGEEPEWNLLARDTVDLLGRTKDITLAAYLCRAGSRLGDLDLVLAGAGALAGLLEQWNAVYPSLEELGPEARKSPCDGLAQRRPFLGALEACPLIRSDKHGLFSAEDLTRFTAQGESADNYIYFMRAMNADGAAQLAAAMTRLDEIEAAFRRADSAFSANAPIGAQPDLSPLFQTLRRMRKAAQAFVAAPAQPAAADDEGAVPEPKSTTALSAPSAPGQINSREDVVRALDAICAYYARVEPASPVPLALQRARSWVKLDFLALLSDIAPDSLGDARRVLTSGERARED